MKDLVVGCWLIVVRMTLIVERCSLIVERCSLFVERCSLFVERWAVACGQSLVKCLAVCCITKIQNSKFKIQNLFYPLLFTVYSLLFASCNPPEDIPSYIRVQSYTFKDSTGQGSSSSKVTHIWVNVENDDRGAYQIPVSVPVLTKGWHTVSLQAAVKENGISANILPYPFYTVSKKLTNLVPGQLDTIIPAFKYLSNTLIEWGSGNFEGSSAVLNTTAINSAYTHTTKNKDSVFEGTASYEVDMSTGHDTFDIQSNYTFNPTAKGTPVWMEMDYKTDVPMDIGLIILNGSTNPRDLVCGVNPIGHWNKIYVNLGPTLQYYYPTTIFKIYFQAINTNGGTAHILLDNLKILHF